MNKEVMMFKIITNDNLEHEHICCSISGKDKGVLLKKKWLKERLSDGLVFNKLDERGKVFIEYIPAESAFAPITAKDYMYINCFWVSGKFKQKGYGSQLLTQCIEDSKVKGKKGLVVLSSNKKKPFLSDPKFLKKKGFEVCDSLGFYDLMYMPFEETIKPKFKDQVSLETEGNLLYYTHQCPHTEKYVGLIKSLAENHQVNLNVILLDTKEKAQSAISPFTTYSLYLKGEFVTNEILTEKKFLEYLESYSLLKNPL